MSTPTSAHYYDPKFLSMATANAERKSAHKEELRKAKRENKRWRKAKKEMKA